MESRLVANRFHESEKNHNNEKKRQKQSADLRQAILFWVNNVNI